MLQSHYDAIYMRCCDFSMDLGEIATFEHLAAPFRLRQSQCSPSATFRNYRRFAFLIPLALCCMISVIQSEVELAYYCQRHVLRASWILSADTFPSSGTVLGSATSG